MPDTSVTADGLRFENPFVVASGPPTTNARVIERAFREGWGGAVAKTICLDADTIHNVAPRYARIRVGQERTVVGWENIELISDRPFEVWMEELAAVKSAFPDRVLVASIMETTRRDAWHEIVERTQATGVDALELNLSCPHGLPERRMGSAVGEDPELLAEVAGWVAEVATVPVWAKLTPNVTRVEDGGRAALAAGLGGLSAINTIRSIMGVDLETLRPEPTVEGRSTFGGYSGMAVRPIAMRMVAELAQMIAEEFPGRSLHAIGGVESGDDAAQHVLLGADTVQVCTGVMIHGYGLIRRLVDDLRRLLDRHGMDSVAELKGRALEHLTTHAELVRLQAEARDRPVPAIVTAGDGGWTGERFVEQTEDLVAS